MQCEYFTKKGGTFTTDGFVKHKRHPNGFNMPVRVNVNSASVRSAMAFPAPVRDSFGKLVYMLPGGRIYVGR